MRKTSWLRQTQVICFALGATSLRAKGKKINKEGAGGSDELVGLPRQQTLLQGPAGAADAASASGWWQVPHWSNGGRDLCAVSLSWIIKVKISHLQKGEVEGTGSCQLSAWGAEGGVGCVLFARTNTGGEAVDVAGGGEGDESEGLEFSNEH